MPSWDVRFDLNIDQTDQRLLNAVYGAQALGSVIRRIPLPPLARERIDRLNILRAVRGTTALEGSPLSEDEVQRVLDQPEGQTVLPSSRAKEEIEVRNARQAMRYIAITVDRDEGTPVTETLIREIHRIITSNIDYANNQPGRYRGHGVTAGEYRPPGADQLERLMAEFVAWINGPSVRGYDPIISAVAAHFYFISIHPFGDGNGRTARALESFLLYRARINELGFYSLSNFYYRHREQYISFLDHCRFQSGGDLTPFIRFAAEGLFEELEVVRDEVLAENTRIAFSTFARETLATIGGRAGIQKRAAAFMDLLILAGSADEARLRTLADPSSVPYATVSTKTLLRDLVTLERLDLIVREEGKVRPKLEIMEQFPRPAW
jgi:Fic family protein